jgi:hypothetical protein
MFTKKRVDANFLVRQALSRYKRTRFEGSFTLSKVLSCRLDDSSWQAVQDALYNQKPLPKPADRDVKCDMLEMYLVEQYDGEKYLVAINDPFELWLDNYVLDVWPWYEGCV